MTRKGFTLIELLIVVAVLAILLGIAALDVRPLSNDARIAASDFVGAARLARSRAMGTTSSHRLVVADEARVRVESALKCTDPTEAWVIQPELGAEFRSSTSMIDVAPDEVLACYDPRGIASASPAVTFRDGRGRTAVVDIFAGGNVEIR